MNNIEAQHILYFWTASNKMNIQLSIDIYFIYKI